MDAFSLLSPRQWAALAGVAVLVFWVLGAYNRLMGLRAAVAAAWQQCDAVLRPRSAALQKLVLLLRDQLAHEHATLDALLVASTQVDAAASALRQRPLGATLAAEYARSEASLAASLARTRALVAQRPELAAHPQLQPTLQALQQAEPPLAFGRQLFNQAARHYNQAARQIPTRLVARVFSLGEAGEI